MYGFKTVHFVSSVVKWHTALVHWTSGHGDHDSHMIIVILVLINDTVL